METFISDRDNIERVWKCPDCKLLKPFSQRMKTDDTPTRKLNCLAADIVQRDSMENTMNGTIDDLTVRRADNANETSDDSILNTSNTDVQNHLLHKYNPDNINMTRGSKIKDESPFKAPVEYNRLRDIMHEEFGNILSTKLAYLQDSIFDKLHEISQRLTKLEAKVNTGVHESDTNQSIFDNEAKGKKIDNVANRLSIIEDTFKTPQLSTANKDTPKNTTNNNSKKNNVNKKTKPTGKNQEEKLIVGSGSKPLQQEEILVITEQKIQELTEPDQEGWNKVVHQKSKRSIRKSAEIRRGTADPGFTTLQASEKVTYLHLYYVKVGTSDKQVSDHLKKICSGDVCTVDTLKARGNYASFKLGVPPRLVEEVLSTTNWATNICIRPWRQNFRVKQHNGERQSLNRH
ncbi:hypothetical protein O0L34_g6588 [Tuta absoluta]|nr:hypothetical protein O0L34_g6588 [Tuta absoluta]